MTQAELVNTIETLVDREGLYAVTAALELMCHEKSEHLICNWQDKPASKRWTQAAKAFYNAHKRLEQIQIP